MKMQAICESLLRHVKQSRKMSKQSEARNRWFDLPREIRDQIYREILCKRYLIHRSARWKRGKAVFREDRPLFWFRGVQYHWRGLFWSGYIGMKKRNLFWAQVSLLLTSKAIYEEATDIMYEGSLFCVYVGQQSQRWYPMTPLPPPHLLDRMQNIEMGMCVCNTQDYTASETWFNHFNASHTKRNTCCISFPCYYCLVLCHDYTPYFRACRSLIGFKTVILTLKLRCREETLDVYDSIRKYFKAALEPHLGPSRYYDGVKSFSLEFYPRKHLEDVQAGSPTFGGEGLALEEDSESGAAT